MWSFATQDFGQSKEKVMFPVEILKCGFFLFISLSDHIGGIRHCDYLNSDQMYRKWSVYECGPRLEVSDVRLSK